MNRAPDTTSQSWRYAPSGRRPRIGIALSSGAARGWAHIGVLKALIKAGIEPDVVCGTSVGAAVGGAYVSGCLDVMEEWVRTLRWRNIVRMMDVRLRGGGFIGGERIMAMFAPYLADTAIEDLPKPFASVATNLAKGHEIWFREGPLLDAVRASIALPGIFTPVEINGQWFVDGALVNPIPISVCRALGADLVIAVNLHGDILARRPPGPYENLTPDQHAFYESEQIKQVALGAEPLAKGVARTVLRRILGSGGQGPGLFDVMFASLAVIQDRITRSRLAGDPPDVMLVPRVGDVGMMEFDRAAELIEEGEACTVRKIEEIREAVAFYS